MRIIAGTHKGATIFAPADSRTRPTADKVRGAIFNMLGSVEDMRVLDLFAGSGALGLEALSRGASEAVLVENHASAVKAIVRNVTKLKLDNARAVRRDYLAFLKDAVKKDQRFDLIFVDPPYKMHRVIEPELKKWLPQIIASEGIAVVESGAGDEILIAAEILADKIYGDTRVRIFTFPQADNQS